MRTALCLILFFGGELVGAKPVGADGSDPVAFAAEYYLKQSEYDQALSLWERIHARLPRHVGAIDRVADLKLLTSGRVVARDFLAKILSERAAEFSDLERQHLIEKLHSVQTTFLTDEGQSLYYRALPKTRHGDWPGALNLLIQASPLERGSLLIFRERARCEREMALWPAYYESLKSIWESYPYDNAAKDELFEAHIYFRGYDKILANVGQGAMLTRRQRIALGVALVELGQLADAEQRLLPLAEEKSPHPAVLEALSRLLNQRPETRTDAERYRLHFLETVAREPMVGWDPYRLAEKIAQREAPPAAR